MTDMQPLKLLPHREVQRWENGSRQIDIQRQFRELNKDLCEDSSKNRWNYTPETLQKSNQYWRNNEARIAHGYPGTAWLQLGLLYGCGLYTAKEQGLIRKGVILTKFWKFHYFDWIMFMRRGLIFAWAGGLLAGTVMFGSPNLSLKRTINRYNSWIGGMTVDYNNKEAMINPASF